MSTTVPQITYAPAAATALGYQQYTQYAHQPGYSGVQLSQQAYVAADTNHDGQVSQAEMQYASAHQPHQGFFASHFGHHAQPQAVHDPSMQGQTGYAGTTITNHGAAPVEHQGFFASHFGHHAQPQTVAPTTYMPAAATGQGYEQYMQYAHQPGHAGVQLSQQAYVAADTNHDGQVSQAEMQYATAHQPHQGFLASHLGHHAQPQSTYMPAAATGQGYQQYMQYAHQPGYAGVQLSQQAYVAADTNHDGQVSQAEMQYATAHYQPISQAGLPTAQSMVAIPAATRAPAATPAAELTTPPQPKKKVSKKKKSKKGGCC